MQPSVDQGGGMTLGQGWGRLRLSGALDRSRQGGKMNAEWQPRGKGSHAAAGGIHLDCLIMHFCLECNYALIQTLNFSLSSHIDTGERRNSNTLRSGCHRQWGHKDMRHD